MEGKGTGGGGNYTVLFDNVTRDVYLGSRCGVSPHRKWLTWFVRELPSGVQDLPALVPRDDLQVHLTWRENGYRILKTYSKRYPFNC